MIAQLTSAATHAEQVAAARALSRIAHPQAVVGVLDAIAGLPLDEPSARESVFARAAVRLNAPGAEQVLLARLKKSIAAQQSLAAEIESPGQMRSKENLPLLLGFAGQVNLSSDDRRQIASALGPLGDDRAVPVLTGWLRGNNYKLKESALAPLENLDSQMAARQARPLLQSEVYLPFKLRLARLLARHDLADGYALATEHLADVAHTAGATLVVAALDNSRTSNDPSAIVATWPDRRWHAASLTGLAAIGDARARKQLLNILSDHRHALAADAAMSAGRAADSELLLPLATLVRSRNKQIALASFTALHRFLSGVRWSPRCLAAADLGDGESHPPAADIPAEMRSVIAEAVALLVVDAYVEATVRHEASAVSRLLRGERYAGLLSDLADLAELEGTPLLAEVQAERRRSHGLDEQP